ncbi:MAG TPA: glutamate synthase large subunit [Pirellulales bacterium]|jgi:glutamate synthase (ferredoxin)|nr:glutamate synthase large subunit [Pirellulales bacterium]
MRPLQPNHGLPPAQGLYDPAHEHDACGVGFVVQMKGVKSHKIVRSGLEILVNLTHRGACGCDPLTGDGAGILVQMPHDFLVPTAAESGITLPALGSYGAGLVFLPRAGAERQHCEARFAAIVAEEGQTLLGWRDLPTDNRDIGRNAKDVEPYVRQVFIARGPATAAEDFEWKLYVVRKRLEIEIRDSALSQKKYLHFPSLSSRVMVYKGLLLADQVERYFSDLTDERFVSALALVHQRYSTNTFPTWDLAHPFRFLAHNGEINTLRGNVNWMHARESMLAHPVYGPDLKKVCPILTPGGSDSMTFDNALELLVLTGRSLPEAMSMLIPEPWAGHESMPDDQKAYYEYKACLIEPWDGPASMAFTDGTIMGAVLDRNGLRPSRFWITQDDFVIMASEAGVLDIPPEEVVRKGRLRPGRMFLVDTAAGRIIRDDEIKQGLAAKHPYRQWLNENQLTLDKLPKIAGINGQLGEPILNLQRAFGYTLEDLRIIMRPMGTDAYEALGSMGDDTPLAVLSDRPQLLYNYFKQLFAQVTNPPLDAIREEIITSMITTIGSEGNLLDETPEQCRLLRLDAPVITNHELAQIKQLNHDRLRSKVLSMLFPRAEGAAGLQRRLDELRREASAAIAAGFTILILSDRGVNEDLVPIPALLATSAVHHHLIREETRTRCGLVIETGEAREVHHFALLTGYGAGAVNPYLAFATLGEMLKQRFIPEQFTYEKLCQNFVKAAVKGVLKVMSKMGISTQQSYRGAQIFEAVGLSAPFIEEYFLRTPSRIEGIGLAEVAQESLRLHEHAYPSTQVPSNLDLDVGGRYQWRRKGEAHVFNPEVVSKLQHAAQLNSREEFKKFCSEIDTQQTRLLTLRGLLEFKPGRAPVPLSEVESAAEIVKRFATGAMSYGSISKEAHETLAIAMNRIGGKSNTGEGGEDPRRYTLDPNGDDRNSAIKQVASGRFGVTSLYLVHAKELQIKMAQGAKPGEGGQLPGHKVDREIGRIRHSTPGVGLISPPPHHDIYSIEDLAQLIHDLKNSNRDARISVKLVAEVGVGTVAAGVAKGKSDVVLISGYDGGTGASPQTSIKHAGLPWELGLAETHQVLVLNDLRGRIVVQTDGQLRTPKDIAIATMLGAEEWGIATGALVVMGCIMMRVCHLNTCPVGIATQDPVLRQKFAGQAEHVINYFFMVAEGLREIMAELGFRTVNEMVGRVDLLDTRRAIEHWKAKGLDFSRILKKPVVPEYVRTYCCEPQDHGIERSLDVTRLLDLCRPALENQTPVVVELPIRNINRTVGTILCSEVTKRYGGKGFEKDDTIQLNFRGTAGQSIMAFGVHGVTCRVEGDVNDYCGKGLSGGRIIVYPPKSSPFKAEENIIAGNVVLYGATAGEVYLSGIAGERFCVRNSGATAVVEGIGDHGCEYMTGGRAIILGETGRNFAAGMSGGLAYVLDESDAFRRLVNPEMVDLVELEPADCEIVRKFVRRHVEFTGSAKGQYVLDHWNRLQEKFVKVFPRDYKRALAEMKKEADMNTDQPEPELQGVGRG